MITIHKYQLDLIAVQTISLPVGAKVLCVQLQNGVPHIWVLVNTDINSNEDVRFITVGTGQCSAVNINPDKYIGTYQLT